MKIIALAGGVGGAKLADGLAKILLPEDLTIIVNTGDDFEHLGLKICPDLDTVCYTLAGLGNPQTGWGRADESFNALENVRQLGGPDWFGVGDRDLGTHLERTRRLREGQPLSQITRDFCKAWGIGPTVLPMSDDSIPTIVLSDEGELPFQEYFVHRRCEPRVSGFRFQGVETAAPAPGVVQAMREADLVVICPSNPWVSIDPILALPTLKSEIESLPMVAVSPIIGGQAVKGPVVKMYQELGIQPSALAVARHYQDFLSGFVFDQVDQDLESEIQQLNVLTLCADTLMTSPTQRKRLAQDVLKFGTLLMEK
ncbi:MAG TPA: 2-phospho-L-lactate transferase [Chloroflexi bacterium]|nr:2-phospho-L-lactate transferase [Chloroflexota bacterium]